MTTKKPKKRKRPPFPLPPKAVPVPQTTPDGEVKILSKEEVMALLPIKSHVSLRNWIKQGLFPAPRQIGPEGARRSTIGWIASEVYEHLANLPKRLPKGSTVVVLVLVVAVAVVAAMM